MILEQIDENLLKIANESDVVLKDIYEKIDTRSANCKSLSNFCSFITVRVPGSKIANECP